MSSQDQATGPIAAMRYQVLASDGAHWLAGQRCAACGAVIVGSRLACPACAAPNSLQPIRLALTGRVHSHTIVHRSYPGVAVPFVAAVVDLDGGGSIKGILRDVPSEQGAFPADMAVRVVFRDTGQRDPNGREFVSHYFEPAEGSAS